MGDMIKSAGIAYFCGNRPTVLAVWRRGTLLILLAAVIVVSPAALAQSADDVTQLRRELAAKQADLERQRAKLARQQAELERQAAELDALASRIDQATAGAGSPMPPTVQRISVAEKELSPDHRDAVGDLNAEAVAAGDFPGSILIPGTQQVSLAVGGFIKAVAIADSDLEATGPIFLPAYIGTSHPDTEGSTSLDASLSRIYMDARAPTPRGSVRGYLEFDLNEGNDGSPAFQVRHAYGTWRVREGTLTAGHTWSTAMDLGVLPEGLTEPTVSGAIFQRQAQLRWSQQLSDGFQFDVALEDGTSSDAAIGESWRATTRLPDLIAAAQWDWGQTAHLRTTGLLREIRATSDAGQSTSATGWGVSISGYLGIGESDKVALGASVGEGGGRYLLGLPTGSAGFLDVSEGKLDLLRSAGGFLSYRHVWKPGLRSTAAYGRAWVDDATWQAPDSFDSSTFGLVNLLWSPLHYVTFGLEYQYGERKTKDGATRDNNRVIFGVQIF